MLSEIVLEQQEIKFRGGTFTVRGIGLDTIVSLMNSGNRGELETVVAALEELHGAAKADDAPALEAGLLKLIVEMPDLVAKVIAFSAGEPEQWAKVRQLPLPVQLECVNAIGRLTFDSEESIRTFIPGLMSLMSGTTTAMKIASEQITGTKS